MPGDDRFIGNYELIRTIGSGAMGDVYLARHRKFSQREYAIKLIRSDVTTEAARKRFEREITAMGGLVHPNLVYASDAGIDNERMYLVMEYVRGRDLQELIDRKGAMQVPQATEVVRQICLGVAHAHSHGVVHRDIKPANVILSHDLEVKVLDLGIASLQSDAGSRMTRGGSVMGTAAFIAPELWDDAMNASPASDVYAIGCTAYSLYTRSPPFAGEAHQSLVQIMTAHRQSDPIPLHLLRQGFPEELSALILRSLSKDADRRFQDAAEFADALTEFSVPLSKEVSLFSGETTASSYRGPTTTRIGKSPGVGVGAWLVSALLVLPASVALYMAYYGDFVTPAWEHVYGRLGVSDNPPYSGIVFDAVQLIIGIPLACYALARFYPGELKRSFDPRQWNLASLAAKLLLLVAFVSLSYFYYREHGVLEHLPASMAELATVEGFESDASDELHSMRWYLGYVTISRSIFATLTIAFPLIWFLVGDTPKLRLRLQRLLTSQNETTFSGRLCENLHRFGNDLRVQAGRLLAVAFVAAIVLQYNYWTYAFMSEGIRHDNGVRETLIAAITLGCILLFALSSFALVYLRGFEATSQLVAAVGSVKDEEDLSKIGARWLIRSTVLSRLSGIGCLSIVILFGHSLWVKHYHDTVVDPLPELAAGTEPTPAPDPTLVTESEAPIGTKPAPDEIPNGDRVEPPKLATWKPPRCEPAKGSELVSIHVSTFHQRLHSEVVLRPEFTVDESRRGTEGVNRNDTISFMLIPQTSVNDPLSFYMMKDKVTAGMFANFEKHHPSKIDLEAAGFRQDSSADARDPVYNVTAIEAMHFASVVCGGSLPTPKQWDIAFGRYLNESAVRKSIDNLDPFMRRVGVQNIFARDLASITNSSPWGCVNMGSRGLEFTSHTMNNQRFVVPRTGDEVPNVDLQLRGSEPGYQLTLQEWEADKYDDVRFGTQPSYAPSRDISFRVVLQQTDE